MRHTYNVRVQFPNKALDCLDSKAFAFNTDLARQDFINIAVNKGIKVLGLYHEPIYSVAVHAAVALQATMERVSK